MLMDKVGWNIVHCQRFVRGFLVRRRFRGMLELARQDKAAVRGFCVYIGNSSDDVMHNLTKQREHDAERKRLDVSHANSNNCSFEK